METSIVAEPSVDERKRFDGRYELGTLIGRGGQGSVYRAYDVELRRRVALKVLQETAGDASVGSALEEEARVLADLQHPNIVAVHEVANDGEHLYLTMEFIEGASLDDWLDARTHGWARIVAVFRQAAQGLSAAHDAGVVHGDFKPTNVMIDRKGRVRVGDFGLARQVVCDDETQEADSSSNVTLHTAVAGIPPYVAPEQFCGRVSAASDQFAFCTALFEALSGERPWTRRGRGVEGRAEREQLVRRLRAHKVPTRVCRVVVRGLAVAPDERHPSMRALCGALDRAVSGKRTPLLWGIALGGALTVGGMSLSDPCEAPADMNGVWTSQARDTVAQRLSHDADAVLASVDDGAARWQAVMVRSCEAEKRGSDSPLLAELRRRCVQRTAARVGYALEEIEAGAYEPGRIAAALVPAVSTRRCEDDDALRTGIDQDDDVDFDVHDALERGIDRAYVQLDLGDEQGYFQTLEGLYRDHGAGQRGGRAAARVAFQYGTALTRAGEYREAEMVMRQALLQVEVDPRATVATAELRSGLAVVLSSDPARAAEAKRLAEEAIAVIGSGGLSPTLVPAQSARARASALLGEHTEAYEALLVLEQLVDDYDPSRPDAVTWEGYARNRAEIAVLSAGVRAQLGRREDAEQGYLAAIDELRAMGTYPRLLAKALNNAGDLLSMRGDARAAELVEEAARLKEDFDDPRGAALSWMTVGTVRLRAEQHAQAVQAYERALVLLPPGRKQDRCEVLYNLGLAFQAEGEDEQARTRLQAARTLSNEAGLQSSELRFDVEVALLQLALDEGPKAATAALSAARRMERSRFSAYSRAEVELAACTIFQDSNPAEARRALARAQPLVQESRDPGLRDAMRKCKGHLPRE